MSFNYIVQKLNSYTNNKWPSWFKMCSFVILAYSRESRDIYREDELYTARLDFN